MVKQQLSIKIALIGTALVMLTSQSALSGTDSLVRARQILQEVPLIDGHNDLPWTIRSQTETPMDVEAYDLQQHTPNDTDIERLRQGMVGAQFWSVFIPGEIKDQGFAKVQLEQIDITRRMIEKYPETFRLALTADDIESSFKTGKIASLLGMEGGHAIENSLGALRSFYRLGARYMTLTHNVTLDWADASLDEHKHNGLTGFGKEVVREMNRLGMLVDLSHVSAEVMSDSLAVSEAPIIFSHSSALALTNHARNVPDDILEKLPTNGGLMMVTFIPSFVSQEVKNWQDPLDKLYEGKPFSIELFNQITDEYKAGHQPVPKATLKHVADHIEHVRDVAGIDHVGIGSDFWGSGEMPDGLEDVSKFPSLFAELIDRGWSEDDLKKLAGLNFLRVFREAESVAVRLQKNRPASTATIEAMTGKKAQAIHHDKIIRGGTIYDGRGNPGFIGDVAIDNDRIAAVGDLSNAVADKEIDASGLVVSPGFINVLSWGIESLIHDGRGMSDIKQGVTLEVFGEGISMGPFNQPMKDYYVKQQGDIKYDISWTTLGEYLSFLETKGVSPNVASFVGATNIRIHELGFENRPPSQQELTRMQQLVIDAMNEGALGLGSSLIYAPAAFATTDELVALGKAAGVCGGMYISHMRSEADRIDEAVDELITIAREGNLPAEIYHLKFAGKDNWFKADPIIEKIEQARKEGLKITADMYTYAAGQTGLDTMFPPWVQEGGLEAWIKRMKDPEIRQKLIEEMRNPKGQWENMGLGTGHDKIFVVGFKNEALRPLIGKSLEEIAKSRGKSPEETAMDLVIEDNSRVDTIYFVMNEENIRKKLQLPWVSFASDASAMATEGVFLNSAEHPRGYGNFAKVLGKYVRDEKVLSLSEAIRRLTSLPATNLKIKDRGAIEPGYFADIAIFNPEEIADRATYENPHQYAVGMEHVFINGQQVLRNGEHSGAFPGRFVKRAGWQNQCSLQDIKPANRGI